MVALGAKHDFYSTRLGRIYVDWCSRFHLSRAAFPSGHACACAHARRLQMTDFETIVVAGMLFFAFVLGYRQGRAG